MPILLILFSDIHLSSDKDPILSRITSIKNVLKDRLAGGDDIWIIISGDVTYSGKATEYDLAKRFFSEFEKEIRSIKQSVRFNYITVPGNHDCSFEHDLHGDTRGQVIQDIIKDQQLLQKTGIIFDCLKPQQNYYEWCSSILSPGIKSTEEQFVFERVFMFPDKTKIKFIGYNTAWMSLPEKGHGGILFPIQLITRTVTNEPVDLVFSVLHHPYHWIRSDVSKTFRETVESTSNIIITGHEHDPSYQSTTYLLGETRQYIQGGELQKKDKREESTFNTILVDIPARRMKYTQYAWRDTLYFPREFEWVDIPRSRALKQDKFILLKSHLNSLIEPGVPFSHPRKPDLTIDDIYVFPDLEELRDKPESNFIHSNETLNYLLTNNRILVFGPESSGKTSLLKVMFRRHQQNGVVPLWVDGRNITTGNHQRLKSIFSVAFESTYGNQYLEDFWQHEYAKKAIIIDDLQDANLNRKAILNLFGFIDQQFGIALISSSNLLSIQELIETERNDFLLSCNRVLLPEFGSTLRNKIIEKWILLGQEDTIQEAELDNQVREIDAKSRAILRPSLAPSYPFYILTITQSVDNIGTTIPPLSNEDRGSFGFFYEWLITTSLHRFPKKIPDVGAKYRYLSELSYHMYQDGKIKIDTYELEAFHSSYLQRFSLRHNDLPYEGMISDLTSSSLLKDENGYFEFRYPCIYYYFIARTLNSRLQQPEYEGQVKETVSRLANQIDLEENENILLFLSYLSENPYIRDTVLQAAKQMFPHNDPTDLEKDVAFINRDDFDLLLKLPEKKPREIREFVHEQEDQKRRELNVKARDTSEEGSTIDEEQEEQIDKRLKSMTRAFKMVRVMGQIVKNFATSWEGPHKYPITEESYLLGLRVLKEILTLYAQSFNQFVEQVKDTMRYRIEKEMLNIPTERRHYPTDSQLEILARATAFFKTFLISFHSIFAISKYVGTDKLYPIYKDILDKYNSLLSVRLIDVAIKLDCQTHLPLQIMDELLNDLEKNYLGTAILKRLAFHRMALYETDRAERQRCCQMFGIEQNDPRLYLPGRRIGKA